MSINPMLLIKESKCGFRWLILLQSLNPVYITLKRYTNHCTSLQNCNGYTEDIHYIQLIWACVNDNCGTIEVANSVSKNKDTHLIWAHGRRWSRQMRFIALLPSTQEWINAMCILQDMIYRSGGCFGKTQQTSPGMFAVWPWHTLERC